MITLAKNKTRDDGSMSVKKAGQIGGRATRDKYGPDFYSKIGELGGKSRRDNQSAGDNEGGQSE